MTAEQFEIDLGKKLQKLRDAKGKTQAEVADELGLNSRETVKQWESWDRHIKARDLIKLSQYYGVSSDYLLGISEVVSPDPDLRTVCEYTNLSEEAVERICSFARKMQRLHEIKGETYGLEDDKPDEFNAIDAFFSTTSSYKFLSHLAHAIWLSSLPNFEHTQSAAELSEMYDRLRMERFFLSEAAEKMILEITGIDSAIAKVDEAARRAILEQGFDPEEAYDGEHTED